MITTGSEIHLALAAREKLKAQDLRIHVVNLPCWSLFDAQPSKYRDYGFRVDHVTERALATAKQLKKHDHYRKNAQCFLVIISRKQSQ